MQLVIRATSIAAIAVVSTSMLMNSAAAVEDTSEPQSSESPAIATTPAPQADSPVGKPAQSAVAQSAVAIPPSENCFILGSRSFSIPFSVDAAGAQPVEVHLFVSTGPDATWQLLDRKRPNVPQKQFQFEAERDGEFWFATRTIDAQGRSHPDGAIESQLKVYVDTTKPNVKLEADADSDGRVDVTLTVDDATKLKEMRLRYVTDQVKQWQPVDLGKLSSERKLHFTPKESWKQLSIQLVVSDTPGNQSVVNQLLRRPRLAERDSKRFASDSSKAGTDAIAMPYRLGPNDQVPAHHVSNPVIKLDRAPSSPMTPSSVTTAQGYAMPGAVPNYGFRGGIPGAYGYGAPSNAQRAPTQPMTVGAPPQLSAPPQQPYGAPAQAAPTYARSPQMVQSSPQMTQGSPQMVQGQPVAQSPPRTTAQQPASLFERLFGSGPQPTAPPTARPTVQQQQQQPMSFGPPSVRSAPASSRLAATADTGLPSPATPDQISNGFGLNSPAQMQPGQLPPRQFQSGQLHPGSAQPESIPVPQNPEKDTAATRPRPRTAAEAMKPITEPSKVESMTQEEVPTPKPDATPYQSNRADLRAGGANAGVPNQPPSVGDIRNMMQRAPVRYSNSEQFSLAYELEAVGVQGVEAIELYGTTDGGQTWDLWGSDPDRTSPFDIQTNETGVFGFRIVVVGRSGLASARPMAREVPDIVVVVDDKKPIARITGAQYGQGDRVGALVIQYECTDENLKQRPIALAFSDSREGPWTTIAAGLRNDGQYIWNADPNLPRQIYLRIDATDAAGNSGTYILDQPIDAQGLAPRARIRGFQSISGAELSSDRDQTATRPKALFK